jgi:hypothetical protein
VQLIAVIDCGGSRPLSAAAIRSLSRSQHAATLKRLIGQAFLFPALAKDVIEEKRLPESPSTRCTLSQVAYLRMILCKQFYSTESWVSQRL